MTGAIAHLDPWCIVPITSGESLLFGYALWHPTTAGLGWMTSTELLELDAAAGIGRTRSGRRYTLGRRFEAMDVGAEGEEARAAFEHLLGSEFEGMKRLWEMDRQWVASQKVARHLRVPPPARRPADVKTFLDRHLVAYVALRDRGGRR